MYKRRLEAFYRDNPRGLSDSPQKKMEATTAAASTTKHEADGSDKRTGIEDGLEGWVVVLDGLDEFWELKKAEALREMSSGSDLDSSAAEAGAEAIAWRWSMIPITRPIDTLVIVLRTRTSKLSILLRSLSIAMPDIIEYR